MSVEDLEGLEETLGILSDLKMARRVRKAQAEIETGKAEELSREEAGVDPPPGLTLNAYTVEWAPSGKRDLAKLPEKVATAVVEFSYGGLAENPHWAGRELHLELAGLHAARRGDFRVIYRIDAGRHSVNVTVIDHRADVYRRR